MNQVDSEKKSSWIIVQKDTFRIRFQHLRPESGQMIQGILLQSIRFSVDDDKDDRNHFGQWRTDGGSGDT